MGRDADGRLEVFLVMMIQATLPFSSDFVIIPFLDFLNPLGGNWSPNRRPVVAKNADGRLEVFMIGLDGSYSTNGRLRQLIVASGLTIGNL